MSVQATIQDGVTAQGVTLSGSRSVSADAMINIDISVPAAKTGSLTARTDANTGSVTATTGHGITDGMLVDVYWAAGCRRGMTVGTVATNVIPLDGGSGDDLPSTSTVVTITQRTQVELLFAGNAAQVIAVSSAVRGQFSLQDVSAEQLGGVVDKIYKWDVDSGVANPVTGDSLTQIFLSQGDSAAAHRMKVVVLYNT
jgi:hypothetical protein